MSCDPSALHEGIARYYECKLNEHGPTPKGVDWNGQTSQQLRFTQLLNILKPEHRLNMGTPATLNDLGCGYGALLSFMDKSGFEIDYEGIDVSAAMIRSAQDIHGEKAQAKFKLGSSCDRIADYSIASGIFNVKQETPTPDWEQFIYRTLENLDNHSRHGFAFNCLTSYSDAEKMKPHLHYCNPENMFRHCKLQFSRHVALLHDYGLYEFTILIRKQLD